MAFFRRLYRITAILAWYLFIFVLSIPHRSGGWKGRKELSRHTSLWLRGVGKIINLRVKTHGYIREAPAGLLVSNHLGYIDIISHGMFFPLRFTPKADTASWLVIGKIIASSSPIWVHRDSKSASRKALRDFVKTMRRGIYLVVYPEGTSTDGKNGLLPFKSTPFEAVIAGNLPVLPILTHYRDAPGASTVCWYGDMKLFPHIWEVLGLPSIEAELHFLPPIFPEGRSRKDLANHVHDVMDREYRRIFRRL